MPRRPRLRLAGIPFHVIQRGNNRSACFYTDQDRYFYLDNLQAQARKHDVAVHAYVLMTNHAHLLMTPVTADGIGHVMKFLGQRYVQYVNRTYGRSGSLWEGRFRSCLVDTESYLMHCHSYIETNPVRAGMVEHPGDYPWSSYRSNAQGVTDALLTMHPAIASLASAAAARQAAYRELFRHELEPGLREQIRSATNSGFALGTEKFQKRLARILRRPVVKQRRGPRPRRPAKDEPRN